MAKKSNSAALEADTFEGFVRHTCGWVNVKGTSFLVRAGCPKCGQRIVAVEKLSDAEVKELGLKKLSGAALDRAIREQKAQDAEELEDAEDEDEDQDDDDDDSDDDDGDEGDDNSEGE